MKFYFNFLGTFWSKRSERAWPQPELKSGDGARRMPRIPFSSIIRYQCNDHYHYSPSAVQDIFSRIAKDNKRSGVSASGLPFSSIVRLNRYSEQERENGKMSYFNRSVKDKRPEIPFSSIVRSVKRMLFSNLKSFSVLRSVKSKRSTDFLPQRYHSIS